MRVSFPRTRTARRIRGRMRKITLGRFPNMALTEARQEAAAILARIWAGEDMAPPRKVKARCSAISPPATGRTARASGSRHRSQPSTTTCAGVSCPPSDGSGWTGSTMRGFRRGSTRRARTGPGAANRAFDILRAMLKMVRQWGELGEHVPDACDNNRREPEEACRALFGRKRAKRLGAVLDRHREEHPWPVAALRLLVRLSEVLNLRWDEIGELGEDGASARLADSKTGPRTIWLGSEAARLVAALPRTEETEQLFPEDLTANRLYAFWVGVR